MTGKTVYGIREDMFGSSVYLSDQVEHVVNISLHTEKERRALLSLLPKGNRIRWVASDVVYIMNMLF